MWLTLCDDDRRAMSQVGILTGIALEVMRYQAHRRDKSRRSSRGWYRRFLLLAAKRRGQDRLIHGLALLPYHHYSSATTRSIYMYILRLVGRSVGRSYIDRFLLSSAGWVGTTGV